MFCSKVRNIKIALISKPKIVYHKCQLLQRTFKIKMWVGQKIMSNHFEVKGGQIQFLHPLKFFSLIKNFFFRQITDNLSRPQFKRFFFSKSPGFFRQIETMSSRFFFLHDVGGHFLYFFL